MPLCRSDRERPQWINRSGDLILRVKLSSVLVCAVVLVFCAMSASGRPHNAVLFVPDGLRAQIVDARSAPVMARLRDAGVNFHNSHSLFPTFTTANASVLATGHGLGDTGAFS